MDSRGNIIVPAEIEELQTLAEKAVSAKVRANAAKKLSGLVEIPDDYPDLLQEMPRKARLAWYSDAHKAAKHGRPIPRRRSCNVSCASSPSTARDHLIKLGCITPRMVCLTYAERDSLRDGLTIDKPDHLGGSDRLRERRGSSPRSDDPRGRAPVATRSPPRRRRNTCRSKHFFRPRDLRRGRSVAPAARLPKARTRAYPRHASPTTAHRHRDGLPEICRGRRHRRDH